MSESTWLDVGNVAELAKARKQVVTAPDGHAILVVAHEGAFHAFDNICIHKDRELHKGVILNGKLICPGHQWAFDLTSGWENVKSQCQPTYPVRVVDDRVEVDTAGRRVVDGPPSA